MTGKYLSLANEYVEKFKPIIEERTGMNLGEILVRDICTLPKFIHDRLRDQIMFVHHSCPDTIFMNQSKYESDQIPVSIIPIDVAHELFHLTHCRLKNRFGKKSFREGFAEYSSLDNLVDADIYDDQTLKEVVRNVKYLSNYDDFPKEDIPYERGYKFFRKILSVIGKDKVFEVAKSPPISELEVKIPILYLLRSYPYKGIKNIPKFLTKNIRAKTLKKLYGSAPLDFPLCKKGEARGKVFKALPA